MSTTAAVIEETTETDVHDVEIRDFTTFWENIAHQLGQQPVGLTALITQQTAWTNDGKPIAGFPPASPWLSGLSTAIANFKTNYLEDPAVTRFLPEFMEQNRVKLHHSTVRGDTVSLFLMADQEEQTIRERFGMTINGEPPAHKLSKRLAHTRTAQRATLADRQMTISDDLITVPISNEKELEVIPIDTAKLGDGSGYITLPAAVMLCQASGMSKNRAKRVLKRAVAIQWFVSGTKPLKGLLTIRHDMKAEPLVVIDAENIKNEVSFKATGVKFNIIDHPAEKDGPPVMWTSYLTMGMAQIALFGSHQVAEITHAIVQSSLISDTQRLNKLTHPSSKPIEPKEETQQPFWHDNDQPLFSLDFLHELLEISKQSNSSPWSNAQRLKSFAGGFIGRLNGRLIRKNNEIPLALSGRQMILVRPGYAGSRHPERGYASIAYHAKQAWGIGFHPEDSPQAQQSLDGADFDLDMAGVQLVIDADGKWKIWVQRCPRSPGGGAMLNLTERDAKALLNEGFIPYRLTGELPYAHVHEVDDTGNLKKPYSITPMDLPEEMHPKISGEPWEDLEETIDGARERGIMGAVCNVGFLLEHSNLFSDRLSFLLSDVIDANGTAAFQPMLDQLMDEVIVQGKAGKVLEECFQSRVQGNILDRLQQTGEATDSRQAWRIYRQFKWGHKPACNVLRQAIDLAKQSAEREINRLGTMANGPASLFTNDLHKSMEGTQKIARKALLDRNAVWRNRPAPPPGLSFKETLKRQSESYKEAVAKETAIMQRAEAENHKAGKTSNDLREIYWREAATYEKRFHAQFPTSPVKISPLGHLQDLDEHEADTGEQIVPTLMLRSDEQRTITLNVGQVLQIARDQRNGQILLANETAGALKPVMGLTAAAEPYMGLTVKVIKFVPVNTTRRRSYFSLLMVEVLDILPKRMPAPISQMLAQEEEIPLGVRVRVSRDANLQYKLDILRGKRWRPAMELEGICESLRALGPKEFVLESIQGDTAVLYRPTAQS